jgi:SpoVK/Ycf46/Vps4 family AAA+-type ATPase
MKEPVNQRNEAERIMQQIEPGPGTGDARLPEPQRQQVINLAAEIRESLKNRPHMPAGTTSLDAVVFFVGPGGTGKTMAAQVLARELGAEAFRIDVAQVVSKYIGETEKNLSAVFESAAASGNPVLFFDEADTLFGKRVEVKDSHDRYGNIEVNYMLERAGAYRGAVILACYRQVRIDRAIRHAVEFPA